ncbi:MAG: molybdenum cofactor biosynthesis protein MoaE [Planctomycetota bacterium]
MSSESPQPEVLVRRALDGQRLLAQVADQDAGANILFLGTTRRTTGSDLTEGLDYEAHEPMAAAALERLAVEALKRFALTSCAIEHRLGWVPAGEASIAVALSSPHRRAVFAAVEWLMERIKAEVPIWKCAAGEDGSREWVHPGDMRGVAADPAAPGGSP